MGGLLREMLLAENGKEGKLMGIPDFCSEEKNRTFSEMKLPK